MQCFIPYTDELLEQMPNLKKLTLVPFVDEYIDYVMDYQICDQSGKTQWNKVTLAKEASNTFKVS